MKMETREYLIYFQVPSPYRQLDLEPDKEYLMVLTQVDSPNTVYLQFTTAEPQDGDDPGVNRRNQDLDELERMSIILQEDAPSYPQLDTVRPGLLKLDIRV